MKKNLSLLFFCIFLLPLSQFAQIEKVIVETYYIADKNDTTDVLGGRLELGAVTYRVYVDLKPGNKLRRIYSDKNHALKFSSTKPFYNYIDGATYGKDFKRNFYGIGTAALDSWITIGQTATKTNIDGKANFGILKYQDTNGSFIGGSNNDGGNSGISGGLLTNTSTALGIPITVADGMTAITLPSYTWSAFGIRSFPADIDSSIFGSIVSKSEFISYNAFLQNLPGMTGINPDSNQILIAQLTTKGKLSFELNLEVEQLVNNVPTIFKYVANGDTLVGNEAVDSYLKYPYAPLCGCKDYRFLEYSAKFVCSDSTRCVNRVVYGCKDTMACNFDPKANFSTPLLCCYPGLCNGREISVVCPVVRGAYAECSIQPNPAQTTIFLNVISGVEVNISYSVFNYSGTVVLKQDLGPYQKITNYEIDLSGLNNGLYLIRVDAGVESFNRQFIKN
jgi:hypothetical protein